MQNSLGCEKPTQAAVWEDENENEFFSCPIKFISEQIFLWFENYKYDITFGTANNFESQSAKYIDAVNYFNTQVKIMNQLYSKNKPISDSTSIALNSFRTSFKKGKPNG